MPRQCSYCFEKRRRMTNEEKDAILGEEVERVVAVAGNKP